MRFFLLNRNPQQMFPYFSGVMFSDLPAVKSGRREHETGRLCRPGCRNNVEDGDTARRAKMALQMSFIVECM